MDGYYYLASSLPSPQFGQPPPLSFEEFKETCARLATKEDALMISQASLVPPHDCGEARGRAFEFLSRFWKREFTLRNELVRLRAEKNAMKAEDWQRGDGPAAWDDEALQTARRAFGAEDPLKAEFVLARALWDWLDSESAGHRFDTLALSAYAIKVLVLERLAAFTEETGVERYDSMYRTIFEASGNLGAQRLP